MIFCSVSVLQKGWLNLDVASPVAERAMQKTGMIADKMGIIINICLCLSGRRFFPLCKT